MTAPGRVRQLATTHARSGAAGGAAFLVSSAIVHVGNYAYNVVMGRSLGPALFSDLAVIVTLLLVVTLVAGTVQTTAAKVATEPTGDIARPLLRRRATSIGVLGAAVLAIASGALASFFNCASPWPFVIFGAGLPAYFAQAVDRGYLQGHTTFGRLAVTYQAEMWTRLGGALLAVWVGLGLNGAVAALSLSFVASWATARPRRATSGSARRATNPPGLRTLAGAAGALALGEVLISHSDLLIVKHFAEPITAGAYSALAVVGRVPFFAAWSVAAVAFPVAARAATSADHQRVSRITLGVVAGIGAAIIAVSWAVPELIIGTLFGTKFAAFAGYLAPYALAATLFAITHTAATLELAAGRTSASLLVLGGGLAQAVALLLFHGGIGTVVAVQVIVMVALAATVATIRLRSNR